MPTIVSILTFMSRINFMLNWVEDEKSFTTLRPEISCHLTHICISLAFCGAQSNSADLNQTPHNAASDQGLYCLLSECSFDNWIKIENTTQQPLKMKWTGPKEWEILFSLNGLAMNKNGAKLQVQAVVSWICNLTSMKWEQAVNSLWIG